MAAFDTGGEGKMTLRIVDTRTHPKEYYT